MSRILSLRAVGRRVHLGLMWCLFADASAVNAADPSPTIPSPAVAAVSHAPEWTATVPSHPAGRPSSRRDETVAVVDRVKGSVVNIHSERTVADNSDDPFRMRSSQPQRVNGMGTGIVLDPRGYVVTNYHVIDDVQSLKVRLVDGTTCTARVIAADKESDLALIKIDPPKPLPVVALGTAKDLMLAEKVIAIGNAYGYEHSVTTGTVSALNRDVTLNKEISYKSLIQTQAPINPGNSGGPLFNKLGEVVGVNVAIRAGAQNIAFAIPVDTMIAKTADMLGGRKRAGARNGLTLADRYDRPTEDGPLRRWVSVQKVETGSVAEAAGLKTDDVIEKVGDMAVYTTVDVERALLDRAGGSKLTWRVKRATDVLDLELIQQGERANGQPVAERSMTPASEVVWQRLGVKVQPVGVGFVSQADRQLRGGLYIAEVAIGSVAAKAGLVRGDILIGLHQWESLTIDNAVFVLTHKDLATFNPLKAYFVRDGRVREVPISIE